MNNTYKRPMGATERMRLWFPNINVVMAARIRGNISADALRAAIAAARQKHPLLGARVMLDEEQHGYFTTQAVPEIPLERRLRENEDAWIAQMQMELEHTWPITTGPLCRFVWLHSPTASELIINAHHSMCDGRSLAYLFQDILTFMQKPALREEVVPITPVPLDAAVPKSTAGSIVSRFFMHMLNKAWLRKGITFNEQDYADLHQTFWEAHQATVWAWSWSAAQTSGLVSRCRQQHVSVNSAIYVAFLAAQYEIQGNTRKDFQNILVPVDFRDYLTDHADRALGLYASALQIHFVYPPEPSFWDTVRAFDIQVKQNMTQENVFASQQMNVLTPSLLDGIGFAMFGTLEDKLAQRMATRIQDKMRTGMLVSNLGHLEIPVEYGDLYLEAIIPPAIYAGNAEKALEILTVGDQLHMTLTFDKNNISPKTVKAIKARAMHHLTQSA